MDVIKEQEKSSLNIKYIGSVLFLIILTGWYFLSSNSYRSVDRKELLINTVERGSLVVQVEGYGKLRSSKQKSLTSQSNATVEEIVLKPGALVTQDSIIVRLKNPELENEVKTFEQAYISEQAALRKLKLTQLLENLEKEEQLELIKADRETAKLRKNAMQGLVEDGIVSKLDYGAAVLNAQQLEKRVAIIQNSVEKLKMVHVEAINIQSEAVETARGNYESVREKFAQLTVRASMEGILQKLPVELGQSLNVGQQIALIGGTQDLVALIKVPQAEASKIRIGQSASVDTRKEIIKSEVLRVSPTVEDGSVEVEVALFGELPSHLRPEQIVDALIHIDQIDDTFFIQRPSNTNEFTTSTLYKVSQDGKSAKAAEILFGISSGQYIQIVSGAALGDGLVISDLSYLNGEPEIGLKN